LGLGIEVPSGAAELEEAIRTTADVVDSFRRSDVLTLGQPAGEVVPGVSGSESDLLHYAIEPHGEEKILLPVFTRPEYMTAPLQENRDWQTLSVLRVAGKALLDNVDDDVTIVINPGSEREYPIDPSDRQ
jgi:hypothetical protein